MLNFNPIPMKPITHYILIGLASASLWACTDLKEEMLNEQNGDELISNSQNVGMIAASSYALLRDLVNQRQVWGFNEITTDEVAFPARGTDGNAPDRIALFTHEYAPASVYIKDGWNSILSGIAKTNVSLQNLHALPPSDEVTTYIAEVQFIRALLMYYINDIWGQVPFREYDENDFTTHPKLLNRQQAVERIIAELEEIIPTLKPKPEVPYGRISRATAQLLLAKVYLNYEVYTGTPKWKETIGLCDEIIRSGQYRLADDYFALFADDNAQYAQQTEAILPIIFDSVLGIGGYAWPQQSLHYSQIFGNFTSLWNMSCTTATFVDTWDETDPRFRDDRTVSTCGFNLGFLVGQQYAVSGEALKTRTGKPLAFTREFHIQNSQEEQGIRVQKYAPNPEASKPGNSSNDVLWFRYADVILMSSEAKYRSGDTEGALATLNQLRSARKVALLDKIDQIAILNERGYELYWEGHRRNDLIRFGTYCAPRQEKEQETPAYRILLPIPSSALESNDQLKQNEGY